MFILKPKIPNIENNEKLVAKFYENEFNEDPKQFNDATIMLMEPGMLFCDQK